MDYINYGDKIICCAMCLYVGYINEATNFAESQGGGGSDTKDGGREKDENEIEWIRRCLRQATKMVKPRNGKGFCRYRLPVSFKKNTGNRYSVVNIPCRSVFYGLSQRNKMIKKVNLIV